MQDAPSIAELFDACAILFGSQIQVSIEFINYLQPEGVKAAYRKKVLETHPDRALVTGENVTRMKANFIKATAAYQKLSEVVMRGGIVVGEGRSVPPRPEKTDCNKPSAKPAFFTGSVPSRKLLIGQFLYYSGCISWNTYIDALVWQKRQRPPVGQIALGLGILSTREIQQILMDRMKQEKFGESAIRLGYLTPYKLMALLGKQRRFHQPLGEYFVRSGVLTRAQVELMANRQSAHNKSLLSSP